MKTITISTDGRFAGRDVHSAESVDYRRVFWSAYDGELDPPRDVVEFTVTPKQAFDIAIELLFVAVDQGLIAGWNVTFPPSLVAKAMFGQKEAKVTWLDGSTPERDSALSA